MKKIKLHNIHRCLDLSTYPPSPEHRSYLNFNSLDDYQSYLEELVKTNKKIQIMHIHELNSKLLTGDTKNQLFLLSVSRAFHTRMYFDWDYFVSYKSLDGVDQSKMEILFEYKSRVDRQNMILETNIAEFYEKNLKKTKKRTAIILNIQNTFQLEKVFPNLKVDKFEYMYNFKDDDFGDLTVKEDYSKYVDLSFDEDIWDLMQPIKVDEQTVDVIINTFTTSMIEHSLCDKFSDILWNGKERITEPPTNQNIFITIDQRCDLERDCFKNPATIASLFSPSKELPKEYVDFQFKMAIRVSEFLEFLHHFKWIKEDPNIYILSYHPEFEPVVEKGTEQNHVIQCSPAQFEKYFLDKSAFLLDSKGNEYGELYDRGQDRYWEEHDKLNWRSESFLEQLNEIKLQVMEEMKVDTVIFYCNHSNSSSPDAALRFFEYLKCQNIQHYKVMFLEGGIHSFIFYLGKKKMDFNLYFKKKYDKLGSDL